MFWCMIFGFFAAVGVLFLLWLFLGALLAPAGHCDVAIRCRQGGEKSLLRRCRWMRELGLLRCPVTIVGSELTPEEQMELMEHFPGTGFQSPEKWLLDTEERQGRHGRAGTGDLTGNHRGGGISEL